VHHSIKQDLAGKTLAREHPGQRKGNWQSAQDRKKADAQ